MTIWTVVKNLRETKTIKGGILKWPPLIVFDRGKNLMENDNLDIGEIFYRNKKN